MERRVALLISAFLGGCAAFDPPDALLYSHAQHLALDTTCLDCHRDADRTDVPRAAPDHETCARCHEQREGMKRCEVCHTNASAAVPHTFEDRALHFSHAGHMTAAKGNCARCHEAAPRATDLSESLVPTMSACTAVCHEGAVAEGRCDTCHEDLTRYALEEIRFVAHAGGFERTHGARAAKDASTCATCHERSFCSDCHSSTQLLEPSQRSPERATRSFIHPQPYEVIHAVDARSRKETCDGCHRPTFCASCHASVGLASLATLRSAPHPAGWLDPTAPSFHGVEARRSIATCASCHDQGAASACVRCHQVGGSGGNPHPPGFRPVDRESRVCRTCHQESKP